MAAMMAPPPAAGSTFLLVPHPMQHQRPMAGILLNGIASSPASSVQNSPRRHSYYLPVPSSAFSPTSENRRTGAGPSSISSHSSSSSSSSDDVTSSSAQSGSDSLSNSISRGSARKIRFAPLPDPRREVFVTEDGSEIPASEVFADGPSQEACVPAQAIAAVSTPTTSSSSGYSNNSSTNLHATPSVGSLGLYGDDTLSISGQSFSTITGGGSATFLPLEKMNSRNSGCSASAPSSPKRNRWSRLLRLPKKASGSKLSPDFSNSLFRTSSRDSSNSTIDDVSEKQSAMERRQSTGSVGFSAQEARNAFKMGIPLTPITSESGTSSTRPSTAPSSHSPFGSVKSTQRRGTRLLNGRVYGSGARSGNPFKNAKDQEPEFVEWGHGGMGSVQAGQSSEWARLQSNKKLSVGHAEGHNEDGTGDDDGSGMGWVKKRREQREKEKKEREAKEKAEGREGKGDAANTEARALTAETPAITIRSASPLTGAGEDEELGGDRVEESSAGADAKQSTETTATTPVQPKEGTMHPQQQQAHHSEASPEHVYTAVKVPAHLPKLHHHHRERDQLHRSASAGSSHVSTPVAEHPGASILGATSSSSSSATMLPAGAAAPRPSPLSDSTLVDEPVDVDKADSLVSPGALSVSSSSSTDDSDSEDELEPEEDEEDDDEDDEVLDDDEEARKTALCAGVEKVSKHKE